MSSQFPRLKEFIYFVNERWSIHQKRLQGLPAPWTKDEILQTYRFTNIRREDDRVTIWIKKNWLDPHSTDYDTVVFAMALARLVNLPSMLKVLGYPSRWNPERFVRLMDERREAGLTAYNNSYMINAVGATKGQSKAGYLAECVLGPIWKNRQHLGNLARTGVALKDLQAALMSFHGFGGGFMSGQVVADIKWLPSMRKAVDWSTFAVSGPGSRRGMCWVRGMEPLPRYNENEWKGDLVTLMSNVRNRMPVELDAQNLQNCLCEFSKYCKVKYLGRRAKQKFRMSEEKYA